MQEAATPFAIRVRELVVGFGRRTVIDHCRWMFAAEKFSGWSALPVAASRC